MLIILISSLIQHSSDFELLIAASPMTYLGQLRIARWLISLFHLASRIYAAYSSKSLIVMLEEVGVDIGPNGWRNLRKAYMAIITGKVPTKSLGAYLLALKQVHW